jgi:glutathione synthase/RimK-type ligase-like ATP-grasp enzyme
LALRNVRIGFLDNLHPPDYHGALAERLVPLLSKAGACVEVVHAERGLHRLDTPPRWDLVVLRSGSAAALRLAAAAEAWGVPSVNPTDATRLAQDKLASAAILQRAGLPIAPAHLAWLGPGLASPTERPRRPARELSAVADRTLVIKPAHGSHGAGLRTTAPGQLPRFAPTLPEGPYLLMERIPHNGDDLKVFVAGEWLKAIERPFPATTLAAKLGHLVPVPHDAAAVAREAGRLLGLTCFGCDFVRGPRGWVLVDVNAFPGYKGAEGAPGALANEIARVAAEARRRSAPGPAGHAAFGGN